MEKTPGHRNLARKGKGSLQVERIMYTDKAPHPNPPDALHTEKLKGSGDTGQMAKAAKEEELHRRHSASSYLRTKYRNHAEKYKRKCKREGEKRD